MAWTNLPQWKDEKKETYRKMLATTVAKLERKQVRSAHEEEKLRKYKGFLEESK